MGEHVGRSGAAIQQKSFDAPDDVRRFPRGTVNLVHLGAVTMGRGVLEPGFRWSTSLKPIQGTPSCEIHHLQLMLQGRFHVETRDDPAAEHQAARTRSTKLASRRSPSAPLRSGWNWTPIRASRAIADTNGTPWSVVARTSSPAPGPGSPA